jgi:RND superfamily putative drug exporter
VLGSLTVLPALLSRLGDKVDRLRVPLAGRPRSDDGEGRIWGAIVDRVLRRPALSAAVAAGLLLALAAPALQLRLAPQGVESFPKSLEVIRVYTRMQQAFPGSALPADIVIKAPNVRTPAMQRAIAQLERWALASGRAFEPITVDINNNGTVAKVTVPIAGNGTDAALNAAFHLLRDTIVPETVQAVPDTEAGVTGLTAAWKDQAAALKANLLPVLAFVLVLAFALMLLAFRSIVVAAKAIVLNLLSVGAAYGAAILIDATIVRAVLLPATMKLLGDWNWYLPPWLQWLPRLEHEEPPPATPVPTA